MLSLGTVEESSVEKYAVKDDTVLLPDDRYQVKQSFRRKNILSQEEANFWFTYDWKGNCLKHRWARYLRNDKVGWFSNNNLKFVLMGKAYSVASTIWTLFFGEVPSDFVVDFKDGNRNNTSIKNLFIRHYSFITRKRIDYRKRQSFSENYRGRQGCFEKAYTGVFLVEKDDGTRGWQAKFKGHSSFGSVTQTGRLRNSIEEARQDYIRLKTEYMRGLFVYPLWDPQEKVYIDSESFLEPDMVEYFNNLPVRRYQIKLCYRDAYLANEILPDTYSLGDCKDLSHPIIQKYFNKYNVVFKPLGSHIKSAEKKRLRTLLGAIQVMLNLPVSRKLSFEKVISLLSYHRAAGYLKNDGDKLLLDKAIQAQLNLKTQLNLKRNSI